MIDPNTLLQYTNEYINTNTHYIDNIVNELENFRKNEIKFKQYTEELSVLEKYKNQINLHEFKSIFNNVVRILKKFNPENMEFNIHQIKSTLVFFKEIENDLNRFSELSNKIKSFWHSFLNRYPDFKNSKIDTYLEGYFQKLQQSLEDIDPTDISLLYSEAETLEKNVKRISVKATTLYDFQKYYVFLGDEEEKILNEIEDVIKNVKNIDVNTFIEKVDEISQKIEALEKEQQYGIVCVPVYKVQHPNDRKIFKYTLKFGDYYLNYDNFFNLKTLKYINTGEYMYFSNFPIKGVFKGKDIVNKLQIHKDYVEVVNKITNGFFNIFLSTIGFVALINTFSMLSSSVVFKWISFVIFIVLVLSYKLIFSIWKKYNEKIHGLKNIFIFQSVSLYLFDIGNDTDLQEIYTAVIQNFDDTIINKKFHKEEIPKCLKKL